MLSEDRAIEIALMIPGETMMTETEMRAIYRLAGGVEGGWVELGSWCGRSFFAAAMALSESAEISAVDLWDGAIGPDGSRLEELAPTPRWVFDHFTVTQHAVEDLRPDLVVRRFVSYSHEPASQFADDSISGIFIDADHTYEAVKRDLASWLPKIRSGGLISGHDLWVHHPGVQQAVEEFFGQRYTVIPDTRIWWVRR